MKLKIALFISILCGSFWLQSCSDPYEGNIELEQFMYVSLSGAVDETVETMVSIDENIDFKLSVSYAGTTNYDQGDITAEIAVDNSLIEAYNQNNGTSYSELPSNTYSLNKTSAVISNGRNQSDTLTLTVNSPILDFTKNYILPITIKSVSGGNIPLNEELKTVYYVLKGDLVLKPDKSMWTVKDASSVWQGGYEVEKVYDGDKSTYWHSALNGMPQWFIINMNGNNLIEGFTWVNRQENEQTARPKHVKFETSMDGEKWTEVLDIPELPSVRTFQVFELPKKAVAKYFKVNILSNWANAPYTYVAEVATWAGDKPTEEYDWEKEKWQIVGLSSEWGEGSRVALIFDGNKDTNWHSTPGQAMPQWFIVDMMKQRPAIKGFKIWNRQNDHGQEPKHVVFSVSDDNATWTEVLDLQEMSNAYTSELDYKTTTSVAGRYLKVEVLTNWGGAPYTYFGEITPY